MAAGLLAEPWQYRWSSARAYVLGETDPLLAANAEYMNLSQDAARRQQLWREFLLGEDAREEEGRREDWALGDSGNTTMSIQFFHEAASDRLPPMLYVNSALTFNMIGGAGMDVMDLKIGSGELGGLTPRLMAGGSVTALLDGRAGNDVLAANMYFDPRSQGHVTALELGGAGADDLTLNVYGIGDPNVLDVRGICWWTLLSWQSAVSSPTATTGRKSSSLLRNV